jgi:HlyD family secretion protein
MFHKKPTVYFAVAGIAAAAFMVARLQSEPPLPPPPIDPPTKPFRSSVAASGIIESLRDNIAIGVPVAGLVTHVHVAVVDRVERGQPLFTLDRRELQSQLGVNQASAAVAKANLQRLEAQLARLKNVSDPRAVSQEEVKTKEHDVGVARAQVEAADALVAQNELLLQRLTVFAPRAGTILQVNVRPGEYASATPKHSAMVLGDLDRLQVRADIDEQNASRFRPGQAATAYLKGDTTQPIALRFVRVEPYVVPKISLTGGSTERVDTRVLQVIYAFDRPAERNIYVGQQVDVFINAEPFTAEREVAVAEFASVAKGEQ